MVKLSRKFSANHFIQTPLHFLNKDSINFQIFCCSSDFSSSLSRGSLGSLVQHGPNIASFILSVILPGLYMGRGEAIASISLGFQVGPSPQSYCLQQCNNYEFQLLLLIYTFSPYAGFKLISCYNWFNLENILLQALLILANRLDIQIQRDPMVCYVFFLCWFVVVFVFVAFDAPRDDWTEAPLTGSVERQRLHQVVQTTTAILYNSKLY